MKLAIRTLLGVWVTSVAALLAADEIDVAPRQAVPPVNSDEYRSSAVIQIFPSHGIDGKKGAARKRIPEDYAVQKAAILSDQNLRDAIQWLVPETTLDEADIDYKDVIKRKRLGYQVNDMVGTDLTEISVTSVDKEFSRDFANQLANFYIVKRTGDDDDHAPLLHQKAEIGVLVSKNKEQAGAGQPTTQPMKPEFHYTILIAKPVAEVWSALTDKKIIDQYYMAPVHTLELKKGGKISYGGEREVISGTITEIVEPKILAHTFQFVGKEKQETLVSYDVTPIGDAMCSLTISHTGFEAKDQAFADITGGWPVIASSLKTFMETGKGMPWPK